MYICMCMCMKLSVCVVDFCSYKLIILVQKDAHGPFHMPSKRLTIVILCMQQMQTGHTDHTGKASRSNGMMHAMEETMLSV